MQYAAFALIAGLLILAPWFGTDSRDGRDWQPRENWPDSDRLTRNRTGGCSPHQA